MRIASAYAASVWIGVACGSISVAKPRSQETDDAAVLVDLVDDAAIAGTQARVVARILDELDPRSDRHAGPKPGSEKPCALGIHTRHIGFASQSL